MKQMNLEIPPFAALLQQTQDMLKKNYDKLQVSIVHTSIYFKIPSVYRGDDGNKMVLEIFF